MAEEWRRYKELSDELRADYDGVLAKLKESFQWQVDTREYTHSAVLSVGVLQERFEREMRQEWQTFKKAIEDDIKSIRADIKFQNILLTFGVVLLLVICVIGLYIAAH